MFEIFLNIGLYHYLFLSLILFLIALIGVLISRNMLRIIMSLFILTISVVLNFVVLGHFCSDSLQNTNIISVFVLLISVLQSIIALVIMYKIYQSNKFLDSEKTKDLGE